MAWNPVVTRKYLAFGERLWGRTLDRDGARPDGPGGPAGGFFGFLIAAERASATARALRPILDEAASLTRRGVARTSTEAQRLVTRLAALCRRFKLGCPLAFALWAGFMASTEHSGECVELDAGQQAPYRFLADALRAAPAHGQTD